MTRIDAALRRAAARLAASGADSPRAAARVLLHSAAGIDRETQIAHPEAPVNPAALARFAALVRRREAREPLAYVTGVREFRSLEFAVDPSVLVPRPDSETVVEAALARAPPAPRRVLDLGVGSGCLLLALLAEWPAAFGVGVDRSPGALAVAAANARALGMAERCAFVASDWASALAGACDVLVCNPPYVRSADVARLAPEIAWEPRHALDGGADGLDAFRAVIDGAARLLTADGVAAFEIGDGQAAAVGNIMRAAGFGGIVEHRDLSGAVRCLSARRMSDATPAADAA